MAPGLTTGVPELRLFFTNDFQRNALRKPNGLALFDAGRAVAPAFQVHLLTEMRPLACNPNATFWDFRVAFGAPLTNQPYLELETSSEVSNEQTNRNERTEVPFDEKATALLGRAAELYRQIGDPTLLKWIAMGIAILLDKDQVKPEQVQRAITAYRDEGGGWPKQCFKRHGVWLECRQVKNFVRNDYGLGWKRQWDRGEEEPRDRSKPR